MIKIISFKICPFVQRVISLLKAKKYSDKKENSTDLESNKILYKIEYIDLQNKPQWFLDISPNAKVPILITDNGTVLFESEAIIEYIDEIFPKLEKNISPEQRALDRAWSYMATENYLLMHSLKLSNDEKAFNENFSKLKSLLIKVENKLTGEKYFKGKALSNVDIAWLPILHRAFIFKKYSNFNLFKGFDKICLWQSSILKTNIPKQSVSKDFEKIFVEFYSLKGAYFKEMIKNNK